MSTCQAIKKDGKPCTFKANHGSYCGVHARTASLDLKSLSTPSPTSTPVPTSGAVPAQTQNTSGVEPEVVQHVQNLLYDAMLKYGLTPSTISTVLGADAPVHTLKVVKLTEEEAYKYLLKKNRKELDNPIEPMYVCIRRVRETMGDDDLDIFEKNPRANIHIDDSHIEEYQAYRRGIDFYYNTIIPILNKYRKEKSKKMLYTSIEWNNFFVNEIHNSIVNNKDIYWNNELYSHIIEIID
jgi:hypothetical protein